MNESEVTELLSSLGLSAKVDSSIIECGIYDHIGHLECAGCDKRMTCPILRDTLVVAILEHEGFVR